MHTQCPSSTQTCTRRQRTNRSRVSEVQKQVDEVTTIMQDNIDQALRNQEKAEDLVDRTEDLSHNASMFKKQSVSLKRTMCCKDMKLTLIIVGLVVLIVVIIIIIIATSIPKGNDDDNGGGGDDPKGSSTRLLTL